ncbi:MAG: metallophosphoesterase family protein [Phycisphaeraceae bacterium]|nr:metallophosphoesterase family protein [Phycisphaeraceae bacterium]
MMRSQDGPRGNGVDRRHAGCARLGTRLFTIILAQLFAQVAPASHDPIGVYLLWPDDPTTTVQVNWVDLFDEGPATVWFRAASAPQPADGGPPAWRSAEATVHRVRPSTMIRRKADLRGLVPGETYHLVIAAAPPVEPAPRGALRFRTLPAALDAPLRFVAGGDMMHRREWVDAMNRRAGALDPAFALLGGDLAYDDGARASRWIDWLQSWTRHARTPEGLLIPMIVAVGNHEVAGGYGGRLAEDAPYFAGLFDLPGGSTNFAVDVGDYLSFVVLDSDHTQPVDGAQAAWLADAMARRTGQRFLFACYHVPAWGTTKAPDGLLPSDGAVPTRIREHWLPIFERYGLTAVFEHDHHTYKRTHRIRRNARDDDNGILYLGDGAWGVGTRTVPAPGEAWYLAHAEPRRHLLLVTLDPAGSMHVQAIDASGTVFDDVRAAQPRTRPESDGGAPEGPAGAR